MFKPKGLNHITIRVNRIEDSKYFYGEVLGLELIKTMGQSMAVYDVGNGDTLVIVEAETSYDPNSRDFRVDHFGFYVDEPKQVDELAEYFRKYEVAIVSGPANRKKGRFLFVTDPDGNMIEFFHEE